MSDVEVSSSDFRLVQLYDFGAQTFLRGRLSDVITIVQEITSDKICKITQCCAIEFDEKPI